MATTRAGEPRYVVRYPRFRKGDPAVHPIKEKPSYTYAAALMGSLRDNDAQSPSVLRAFGGSLAPLARSFQQISKDEAVTQYLAHQSRFSSGSQDH